MKAGTESVVYSPRPVSSLRPHGLQHTRFPCPSLSPRACSDLCPVSWWCHQTISSSVIPFSSCPHSRVWLYFNISLVLFPTAFRSFEDKNRVFPSARLDIRALPRLQRSASASKLSYKFLKLDYLPLVGDLHSIALLHLNGAISFFDKHSPLLLLYYSLPLSKNWQEDLIYGWSSNSNLQCQSQVTVNNSLNMCIMLFMSLSHSTSCHSCLAALDLFSSMKTLVLSEY